VLDAYLGRKPPTLGASIAYLARKSWSCPLDAYPGRKRRRSARSHIHSLLRRADEHPAVSGLDAIYTPTLMQTAYSAQDLRMWPYLLHNPPTMFAQNLSKPKAKRWRPCPEARP
jgi:hypothetical protein